MTTSSGLSAQFEAGIHLPDTPFPAAPAGSLVAVLTQGPDRTVVDAQVVHRQATLVAPAMPADAGDDPQFRYGAFLVVNDRAGCGSPNGAISVESWKVVPVGSVSIALGQAMARVLRDTEDQAASIVQQGSFSAADQAEMKSWAWNALQTEAGTDLNQVPSVRDLFAAWLDMQVASIDRQVQLSELARATAELAMQARATERDLRTAGERSRLLTLIPRTLLRNLDQTELRGDLRSLLLSLSIDIPPLFTLRHPLSLESFRAVPEYADEMTALMGVGFSDSVSDAADALAAFGERVAQVLFSAENNNPVTSERIVLAFPTPEACQTGCTVNPLGRTEYEDFRVPSREAVEAAWQSLRSNTRTATLTIGAADVYESVGEASRLSCGDHAPTIRRMLLVGQVTAATNPGWGPLGFASDAVGGVENRYPTAEGGIVYRRPPASVGIDLPLASIVSVEELNSSAYPYLAEVGMGMSPVNDFTIELTALESSELNQLDALYLVMEVDKQTSAADVYIPGVCELP